MLSLSFVCSHCGCVDDIELAFAGQFPLVAEKQLCTFCKTGTWHDMFLRVPYDPEKDNVVNRPTGLSL